VKNVVNDQPESSLMLPEGNVKIVVGKEGMNSFPLKFKVHGSESIKKWQKVAEQFRL